MYIGITTDLKKRIKQHQSDGKIFDNFKVVYQSGIKENALFAEDVCIKMIKVIYKDVYNKSGYIDHLHFTNKNLENL